MNDRSTFFVNEHCKKTLKQKMSIRKNTRT